MRKEFANKILNLAKTDEKLIFISGDLGFMALEQIQEAFGERFINAGVAEQNMISVAAGMAKEGFKVFCYSIAPFIVYRCLEQTRNDVCFHNLPVFLVGNGGGYGYGIMGSSHHCIEDLACLSSMPNMTCYTPAFVEDLDIALETIVKQNAPAYLRLGLGKKNIYGIHEDPFNDYLQINEKSELTIICLGPVTDNVINAVKNSGKDNLVDIFYCSKLPYINLSNTLKNSILRTNKLIVVEEHVSIGGLGQQIALLLLENGIKPNYFKSVRAQGYPNMLYGNQAYHQQMSGLDPQNIQSIIHSII